MNLPNEDPLTSTVGHLFREQSGKLVAVLTRIFGSQNLELAEDVVQDTLLTALEHWKIKGIPSDPAAWMFMVAKNKALNLIKRQKSMTYFGDDMHHSLLQSGYTMERTFTELLDERLVKDDKLRMMFACCDPRISADNQTTLILKTLCGFSTSEVAKAFLTNEETITKRLYRTKEIFREQKIALEIPSIAELQQRTDAVLQAIYLLFNEGYLSTDHTVSIRIELMEEAMMLVKLLTENKHTSLPEVYALRAVMCFHLSRSASRLNMDGELILLENQDRSLWNKALIAEGNELMHQAAFGSNLSCYHLEAAIAYEHCMAHDFESTKWDRIVGYYTLLEKLSPNPILSFHKAIAVFHLSGADAAKQALTRIADQKKLHTYYLYHCFLGEIDRFNQEPENARRHFEKAFSLTKSAQEKKLIDQKIHELLN